MEMHIVFTVVWNIYHILKLRLLEYKY